MIGVVAAGAVARGRSSSTWAQQQQQQHRAALPTHVCPSSPSMTMGHGSSSSSYSRSTWKMLLMMWSLILSMCISRLDWFWYLREASE